LMSLLASFQRLNYRRPAIGTMPMKRGTEPVPNMRE
jgi:hypothetical protein